MDRFLCFEKRSFRYENDDKKTRSLKKIAFIKLFVPLTIVNDDPWFTIVNAEKRRDENDLKDIIY